MGNERKKEEEEEEKEKEEGRIPRIDT